MWRFILKVIVFGIALIVLNTWAIQIMPYGWENTEFYRNLTEFKKQHQSGTNTLFFGSSRTLRNVDPVAFDGLNALNGIHTQSYVLASSAVMHNEQFYLMREFFADKTAYQDLKYLFIELDEDIPITEESLNTVRGSYFIEVRDLFRYLRQISHLQQSWSFKLEQSYFYTSMMLRHHLYLGHGTTLLKYLGGKRDKPPISTHARKGYKPLSPEFPEYQRSSRLRDDREKLLRDTLQVQRNFQRMDSLYHSALPPDLYNPVILETYITFITEMQARGVHVICLIPLRKVASPSLINLSRRLPSAHVINMTVHPDIVRLKAAKYWFDPGHLRIEGSRIYTRLLGESFASLMRESE